MGHVSVQTFALTHVVSFMEGVQLELEHMTVTFLASVDERGWGSMKIARQDVDITNTTRTNTSITDILDGPTLRAVYIVAKTTVKAGEQTYNALASTDSISFDVIEISPNCLCNLLIAVFVLHKSTALRISPPFSEPSRLRFKGRHE